jgi:carbon monoxide dehydrogenase subunit G
MSMDITGEYLVPAARQRVWEALNDPAVLQASIAGCQQLEKVSDTSFTAVVTARVGPISTTFRGSVDLAELDPPNGYTLTGRGQGGAAGFAKMTARVDLQPRGDQTLLRYTARAEIGGKLASVGSRLVQAVAKKNADDFFSAFVREIGGGAAAPAGSAQAPAPRLAAATATEADRATAATGPGGGGLGALVPAWLVLFGAFMGVALGYCLGLLAR